MIVPASMVFESDLIDRGREQLEALGFRVKIGAHAKARYGNLAGTDRERAADINGFFADDEVKAPASVAARGAKWGNRDMMRRDVT